MTAAFWRTLLPIVALLSFTAAQSQTPGGLPPPGSPPEHGPQRPPLFFREEWKASPDGAEHPVTAASVANPDLELTLLVPEYRRTAQGVEARSYLIDELHLGMPEPPGPYPLDGTTGHRPVKGHASRAVGRDVKPSGSADATR